ncbi:MAG: NAD-dependent epimerase/dehydratase family protein [Pseudomonadota bacterium]
MSGVIALTGASGFTGRFVQRTFETAGYSVVGLSASTGCDLTDPDQIRDSFRNLHAIYEHPPDGVIHLAAESYVAADSLNSFYETNVIGTQNLLMALDTDAPPNKVIVASSANVYGNNPEPNLTEQTPRRPVNHYGASKVAMEALIEGNWMHRLPIVITRPFNYTGTGQKAHFLVPKLVQHFRARSASIDLGNLDVVRDFSDVRVIAQQYLRLFECDSSGEPVNLCSGIGYSLATIMDMLEDLSGHSMDIHTDQTLIRHDEISSLIGSTERLEQIIGDDLSTDIRELLKWMLTE